MSSFLAPAMKRLLKPTQKLKPGLLPKNIIPKNKWSVSVLCLLVCALLAVLCCALLAVLGWWCALCWCYTRTLLELCWSGAVQRSVLCWSW